MKIMEGMPGASGENKMKTWMAKLMVALAVDVEAAGAGVHSAGDSLGEGVPPGTSRSRQLA